MAVVWVCTFYRSLSLCSCTGPWLVNCAAHVPLPGATRTWRVHCMSLLLAQSGHGPVHRTCLLSGAKRTCPFALHMSAFDPKRTWAVALQMSAPDPKRTFQSERDFRSVPLGTGPFRPPPCPPVVPFKLAVAPFESDPF